MTESDFMKNWIALLLSAAIAAASARAETVAVTVDPAAAGAEISPDFIGLSYEISALLPDANGQYFFSPDNQALVRLFRTLGVKSLRVGGNTADRPTVAMPAKADIDSLFAFAKAADVKVLYTLRMNQGAEKTPPPGAKAGSKAALEPYDPKADAATAQYILDHYAAHLACFIIGNEPDHYYADFPSYRQGWERFAIAAPGAKFCGPSTTPSRVSWAADFARELGHDPQVAFISQHHYAAGSGRTTNIAAAQEKLLSPNIARAYEKFYDAFVPAVLEAGRHFRLEECNSFSNGGAPGVSDAFAAALWGVDYMYWWASHHASGLNFHTSGFPPGSFARSGMRYAVFVNSPGGYATRALGYAMKAFELGGRGRLVSVKMTPAAANPRVYAVLAPDGSVCVTLVNQEHLSGAAPLEVSLDAGASLRRGQVIFLTAPANDIAAKSGLTLGGAAINDDGAWNGAWSGLAPENGHFPIHLPAATVAVVKLAPQ
jgi:hypothetical protein